MAKFRSLNVSGPSYFGGNVKVYGLLHAENITVENLICDNISGTAISIDKVSGNDVTITGTTSVTISAPNTYCNFDKLIIGSDTSVLNISQSLSGAPTIACGTLVTQGLVAVNGTITIGNELKTKIVQLGSSSLDLKVNSLIAPYGGIQFNGDVNIKAENTNISAKGFTANVVNTSGPMTIECGDFIVADGGRFNVSGNLNVLGSLTITGVKTDTTDENIKIGIENGLWAYKNETWNYVSVGWHGTSRFNVKPPSNRDGFLTVHGKGANALALGAGIHFNCGDTSSALKNNLDVDMGIVVMNTSAPNTTKQMFVNLDRSKVISYGSSSGNNRYITIDSTISLSHNNPNKIVYTEDLQKYDVLWMTRGETSLDVSYVEPGSVKYIWYNNATHTLTLTSSKSTYTFVYNGSQYTNLYLKNSSIVRCIFIKGPNGAGACVVQSINGVSVYTSPS